MKVFLIYAYDLSSGAYDVDRIFKDESKAREYAKKQGDGFMVQEVEVEE
jgi:hypothetical protein